jgi:PEP-CTERM motif-containing protein
MEKLLMYLAIFGKMLMIKGFRVVFLLILSMGILTLLSSHASANSIVKFELSDPDKVVFDYDDFVWGDDYVHFTTTDKQVPVAATVGQTITWDYIYKNPFRVNSGDKGDLTYLKLFGRGDGSEGQVDITFWLTDNDHDKIQSTVQQWTNLKWPANTNKILYGDWPFPNGDDKLGVLKDLVVADFHLEIKVNKGNVAFAGGSVNWEVGDITAVPEPHTFVLVGIAVLGYIRRLRVCKVA